MVRRVFMIAALIAGAALMRPAPTQAATLLVDDDTAQCPSAPFRRIQDAIDAAATGDTVEVCPGTYAEQLRIGQGKNGLTVRATTPQQAIIRPPEALANLGSISLVSVTGATNITIQGFWITGPFPVVVCAPSSVAGVLVERGGSVTVQRNYIAEIRPSDPAVNRCYPGHGVAVIASEPETAASATIAENLIERYLAGGVLVDGGGANAMVARNQILGDGPTQASRQFGVEVRGGAKAEIVGNDIGRNKYTGAQNVLSSGISLNESAAEIRIERNRVTGNDHGIALTGVTGATVSSNQALENAVYGIVAFAGTRESTFEANQARGSGATDCIDFTMGSGTSATANRWLRNDSLTAIPAGICGVE